MFVSSSKDTSAKLYDIDTMECLKNYQTERPVNSACLSPKYDHVSLCFRSILLASSGLVKHSENCFDRDVIDTIIYYG